MQTALSVGLVAVILLAIGLGTKAVGAVGAVEATSTQAILSRLHPPITQEGTDRTPRAYEYVEPPALDLPSDEQLETTVVRGRTFHIRRVPAGAYERHGDEAVAFYENDEESLYFRGSGGGGRFSNERLIIEDCTFIVDFVPGPHPGGDFSAWDSRRGAVVVEGYNEVIVRNSVFVSRMTKFDPIRKVVGSVVANDCLKVKVEDCYFEGLVTGWRGHILVWGSGPTHIRNVQIAGAQQGDRRVMGGGIWVAHGEKIGWTHGGDPDRMIYPNGPLLIENVHVHDQEGSENTDGIYVQSIQPYLIRNTRVENWRGQDALLDLGFRDTFQTFGGKQLANHGAIGVVEHSHFANGYLKNSVGVAGGLIFRNNTVDNAWIFPYVFDGGNWYVLGNEFTNMSGVIASGRNDQLSGWTPQEGMLTHGSQLVLYNNRFENKSGEALPALFVNGNENSPLREVIRADYNIYAFDTQPKAWGIDQGTDEKWETLDAWRQATGNDANSIVGDAPLSRFDGVPASTLELPGGLTMEFGGTRPGLTGPVGVQNPQVLERARAASEEARRAFDQAHLQFEAEALGRRGEASIDQRGWASGGALLIFTEEELTLTLPVERPGRYRLITQTAAMGGDTQLQLLGDGRPVGEPFPGNHRGATTHGTVELAAGDRTLTYRRVSGSGRSAIDRIDLRAIPPEVEEGQAALTEARERAARRRAAIEANTVRLPAAQMTRAGHAGWVGLAKNERATDGEYLLLLARSLGDHVNLEANVPAAGAYTLRAVTVAQSDQGKVQLEVDGQPVGQPRDLAGTITFGDAQLAAGTRRFTLRVVEGSPEIRVRLDRLELVPKDAP